MKLHSAVTVILVLVLLGAIARSPLEGRADDGSDAPTLTPLGLVQSAPSSFLGKTIDVVVEVQAEAPTWNPYVTRFGTDDFRALSVWTDEQELWDAQAFRSPFGLVFARRGGDAERLFADAKPYQRIQLHAVVREVFLGRAWIEATDARRLPDEVGEGAVLHASRAVDLMGQKQWKLAIEDFDRALASNLPERARDQLAKLRETCLAESTKKPQ